MIHKNILIIITLLISLNGNSQFQNLTPGFFTNIKSIAIYDNNLFFTTGGGINKFDISQTNPILEEFIPVLNGAGGLVVIDNELYVGSSGKISKIDLTQPIPNLITIVDNLASSNSIELANIGNIIYFTRQLSSTGTAVGELYKVDVSQSSPSPTLVRTDLFASGGAAIASKGNDLYMMDSFYGIRKMNTITNQIVTISNATYFFRMALYGDYLYLSSVQGNRIDKLNLNTNMRTEVYPDYSFTEPQSLVFDNNGTLYIADFFGSQLLRTTELVLSTNDFNVKKEKTVYPNPTSSIIQISNLTEELSFSIYNNLGEKTINGTISSNKNINVKQLNNGLYFLKFKNSNEIIKFIKD